MVGCLVAVHGKGMSWVLQSQNCTRAVSVLYKNQLFHLKIGDFDRARSVNARVAVGPKSAPPIRCASCAGVCHASQVGRKTRQLVEAGGVDELNDHALPTNGRAQVEAGGGVGVGEARRSGHAQRVNAQSILLGQVRQAPMQSHGALTRT